MIIKFTEYEDLPLQNPPLKEVICQIRFTPLLEIAQKLPTDFQAELRDRYPGFKIKQSIGLESGQPLPGEYEFLSANEQSSAILGFNHLSLVTKEYSDWASYNEEIRFLLNAFSNSYGILLTSRIGLRYINEITIANIGVTSIDDLLNILNRDINCLIRNEPWDYPRKANFQFSIPDNGNELTLRLVFDQEPQPRLIIDLDYFSKINPPVETGVEDILDYLENFHKIVYLAFRWSIEERHIEVFNPMS